MRSQGAERIADLNKTEDGVPATASADERRATRQENSRARLVSPILNLGCAKALPVGQKTKRAKAIRYMVSRREGLTRFLDDGRMEIGSNTIERSVARSGSSLARTASRTPGSQIDDLPLGLTLGRPRAKGRGRRTTLTLDQPHQLSTNSSFHAAKVPP
ncbi:transposase [Mesorhizobium sp. ORM16]|uniref:IS66 family transposase n=1 Tax=Mesorhizobium sp. ORM16 TaxID=3376989 RepID=UPI0038571FD4